MEYGGLLEKANDLKKALSIYKSVLFFAPADNEATAKISALVEQVGDVPAAVMEARAAPEPAPAAFKDSGESPFGDVEFGEAAAPAKAPAGAPPKPPNEAEPSETPPPPAPAAAPAPRDSNTESEKIVSLLKEFRDIQGVEGSIIVDNYGLIVAADIEDSFDVDLLAAVLTGMLRTITQHAEPADFGTFDNAFVESEKINFHLYSIQNVELVIFSNANARLGLLEMKIKAFIEKYLEIEAEL
jgi:predicted regulator of Ras-like GTPase activity (Roadblock/LC7/MglB family)